MPNTELHTDVQSIRERIAGEVYSPADPGWDEARSAWNLAVDQHPELVAMPESADDVSTLVAAAAEAGLRVAVQGTGHNAGSYADLGRTMLIRTNRMRGVEVDPTTRTARVQAGAVWADVVGPAAEHGLMALQGSSHDVGVVGYTLAGGVSFLAREHGLASERLLAVEIVTADGRLRRADRESDPELLWALRGGGGNYGVVTSIEIELLERTGLYAGTLFFPFERSREVLQAWRRWTAGVPEGMTSVGRLLQFPPLPDLPELLRGKSFAVIEVFWLGSEGEGRELLEPLRGLGPAHDTVAVVDAAGLLEIHMDPPGPVPGVTDHAMVGELTAEAVDALVDALGPDSDSPLLSVEIRHAGGALARRAPGAGALGALDGEFIVMAVGVLEDPAMKPPIEEAFARMQQALDPVAAGRLYAGFTERPTSAERIFAPESLVRLREARSTYDPDALFHGNHPVDAS